MMHKVVCWHEESVISVTPRDAVTLTPAAFQAIHHPLQLSRRPMERESGGVPTDEAKLLEIMKGPLRPDGFLFIPVVGGSGTGKSHLVRWAREHLQGTEGWEIRYLPKNGTSIRRVVEEVIRGMDGPVADSARQALATTTTAVESRSVLSDRLLDELALLVGLLTATEADGRTPNEAHFVEHRRQQLSDILRDPVVRRRLSREDAVIPRLVDLAMSGRTPGDGLDDDAIYVSAEDLPSGDADLLAAGEEVRNFLNKLQTIPEYLSMSVTLINEVLPSAVRRVFISNQISLVDVLREVRRELLDRGRELVLFIEDLTVLHGVEREFLDAIVEPAVSAGKPVMAPLRVLFAVTDGHFKSLDTVRTRCDEAFWLDAPYADGGGVSRDEAASFVGRYFNASRTSPQKLDAAWSSKTAGAEWVPNACDGCTYREECHQTFGSSDEGYGLYPLNHESLDQFVGALSPRRFDPRKIVGALVNQFLLTAGREINRSEFPSQDLLVPFSDSDRGTDLDPLVIADIRGTAKDQADRAVGIVRYWGAGHAVSEDLTSTFELRPVAVPAGKRTTRPGKSTPTAPTNTSDTNASGATNALKPAEQRIFDALTHWANDGAELTASHTNALRKLIHASVKPALEYGAVPLNLGREFDTRRFDDEKHISFEGSVSQSFRSSSIIRVERSAENATALQGLLLLKESGTFDNLKKGDQYRRYVADRVESWSRTVSDALLQPPDDKLLGRIKDLIVIARLFGLDDGSDEPAKILNGIVSLDGYQPAPADSRSERWQKLLRMAESTSRDLASNVRIYFGEARGSGAARALRTDLLLPTIADVVANWDLAATDSDLAPLARAIPTALNDEWTRLSKDIELVDDLLEKDSPALEQLQKCVEALGKAAELGRFQDTEALRSLRVGASTLTPAFDQALREARKAVVDTPTDAHRMALCASEVPDLVRIVSGLAKSADQLLSGVESDLEKRRRELGDAVDPVVVVDSILKSSANLTQAVAAVLS
jgi:hypothetical protein